MFHKLDRERERIIIPHIVNEQGQKCAVSEHGQRLISAVRNGDRTLEDIQEELAASDNPYHLEEVITYYSQQKG